MNHIHALRIVVVALAGLASLVSRGGEPAPIDAATLEVWSAPYRNWYYYPEHVIPAEPKVPGREKFVSTDCPTVFQVPGDSKYYMTFIAFDGGYNSFVAESTDLVHFTNFRLAMGFGPPETFDHGGCVLGAYLYESWDIKAPRRLARRDGKLWSLYGCYPRQGGYELRPGYEGLAASDDGLAWRRGKDAYILSVHEPDVGAWEKDCIYQPWLVAHEGTFYDFYNAANGGIEQTGLATSKDLLEWKRHAGNPVIRNRPGAYDENFCSDPKVFRDGDHWTMFYFGVGRGGAHIMIAFSRDLLTWTAHPEPLYKAGGHPLGLDKTYAHKISLAYNPANDTFYMHYCAVGEKGRGIGLITSKPLPSVVNVLPEKTDGVAPKDMMKTCLARQTDAAFDAWATSYAELTTPERIAAYQTHLRAKFVEAIGGFPERTPLNPQVTGTLARDGYRVEKLVFESRPKFFVSAALFLPDAPRHKAPYPGVLIPCGHAENAKAYESYQTMGASLALNGMAALVFDPIDQGERFQLLNAEGTPLLGGTTGHTMANVGAMLLGTSVAQVEIWDGMRALDYLVARPEVDPARIGITGNSGGGTQTSYLMALDDRLKVAAPSCYLTGFKALLATIGPQDGEQNIFGQLAFGMDHADYIMMRAPSPFLICAATKDFFDIDGTWATFRAAKRLYTRLGAPERVELMENDAGHNYNALQRQSVLRWMARWLLGNDAPLAEAQIATVKDEDLRATPRGQVMLLPGARSVYDLNADRAKELAAARTPAWAALGVDAKRARIRAVTGIRPLAELPEPKNALDGKDRGIFTREDGARIPALVFNPSALEKGACLYVDERGKAGLFAADGLGAELSKAPRAICAVDVRGTGETEQTDRPWSADFGQNLRECATAHLLGRSYVAMRAEDILVVARAAAAKAPACAVDLVAVGNVGIPALHAAALEPQLFSSVTIVRSLASWASVIECRTHRDQLVNAVHGALAVYDLPDLAAMLGEKVKLVETRDARGAPVK
jgi:dienelactone hydrolase